MPALFYYLLTFAESVTSVFGVRFPYEQPRYVVTQDLGQDVEIRRYDPTLAIEANVRGSSREKAASEAFTLLFRYITGTNHDEQKIGMTVPVQIAAQPIAMTTPVQTTSDGGQVTMRFFLPKAVADAGAPAPLDARLRLVRTPEATIAARRYSGVADAAARDHNAAILMGALARSQWKPAGEIALLSYDPPFAIPFLRRNEATVPVLRRAPQ